MAKLEQQIMELDLIMLPPFSSNTMSSDTWNEVKNIQKGGNPMPSKTVGKTMPGAAPPTKTADKSKPGGRPEKPDEKKSEKTIKNKESMA